MKDMIAKGRADHTKNARGERVGTSKLTEAKVKKIWHLHLTQGIGERRLGAMFNVTPANIHAILSGKTWKNMIPAKIAPLVRAKNGFQRIYPSTD